MNLLLKAISFYICTGFLQKSLTNYDGKYKLVAYRVLIDNITGLTYYFTTDFKKLFGNLIDSQKN